jgi:Methyltransferase domain
MTGPADDGAPLLRSVVLADAEWQMHLGERFTFEGLLATLRPRLAIEIGRAEGGSLRRIAAHAGTVHSFDLVPPSDALAADLGNVVFHTGDSSLQVPETLSELAAAGGHVDFALVDGDHSAEGVRRDAEALLASDACRRTAIVFHDAANDIVRAGLEAVRFHEHPKVALELLDFVPGFVVESGVYAMQIWNGLGLVVLDEDRTGPVIREAVRYDAAELNRRIRDVIAAGDAPAPVPVPEPAPAPAAAPDGGGAARLAAAAGGAALAGAIAGWLGARARRN